MLHDHVHPYFHDDQPVMLDEETYKELIREVLPNNVAGAQLSSLPYRDWMPLIKFSRFYGRDRNIFKFYVPNKYNGWFTYFQFLDFDEQTADLSLKAYEVARLLLWSGNLRIHCKCPAYLYWGHQYIATQHDAAIIPETRFPNIRNPQLKGQMCKHLRLSAKTLAFHLGEMAHEVKVERQNNPPPPPSPPPAPPPVIP